ncbi:MAG: hypothetical protein H8F28_04150, partial [Fibrella sp.]|nr:hypothetical protein [Armatimonadota bacterium]
ADGTIKAQSGYDQRNTYPRLAKNVAPFDGDGAAWIARQAPENSRWQALLWAASAVKDPAARRKQYRDAVEGDREWEKAKRYADAIEVARLTGDPAIVAEMRTALAKSLTDGIGVFDGNATENAARIALLLGDEMPDACRLLLEVAMYQTREMNPETENEFWLVRPAIAAMAWVDLTRALQIAESFQTPKAVADGKREIVRALTTPPDKWQVLVTR